MKPTLSLICVTWNSVEVIIKQIHSVRAACEGIPYEQVIVDNGSTDQTVVTIRQNFPELKVIENKENKGFAFANNQALLETSGEFLLFLNPDMQLVPGSLTALLGWMQSQSDVGIASVRLVDQQGILNENTKPRRFPRVWESVAIVLKIPHIFPHILDRYLMKEFDADFEQEVESVRGSFMLVRREIVETLGWAFDPRYYIWFEDVDICREAKRLGFKVVYTPIISAVDLFGQSFKKRTSLWKQRQFTKSMLIYFQKWEPWWKWIWVWLARPIGILLAFFAHFF